MLSTFYHNQNLNKYTHICIYKGYVYIYICIYIHTHILSPFTALLTYHSISFFLLSNFSKRLPIFHFSISVLFLFLSALSLASALTHSQPCSYQGYVIKSTEYLWVFILLDLISAFDAINLFKTLSHWSWKLCIF